MMSFEAPDSPLPVPLPLGRNSDERIVPSFRASPDEVAFLRDMKRLERAVREVASEMGLGAESIERVNARLLTDLVVFPDASDRQTLARLIVEELTNPEL